MQYWTTTRFEIVPGGPVSGRLGQLDYRSPPLPDQHEGAAHAERGVHALMEQLAAQRLDEECGGRVAAGNHDRLVGSCDDAERIRLRLHVVVQVARRQRMI